MVPQKKSLHGSRDAQREGPVRLALRCLGTGRDFLSASSFAFRLYVKTVAIPTGSDLSKENECRLARNPAGPVFN